MRRSLLKFSLLLPIVFHTSVAFAGYCRDEYQQFGYARIEVAKYRPDEPNLMLGSINGSPFKECLIRKVYPNPQYSSHNSYRVCGDIKRDKGKNYILFSTKPKSTVSNYFSILVDNQPSVVDKSGQVWPLSLLQSWDEVVCDNKGNGIMFELSTKIKIYESRETSTEYRFRDTWLTVYKGISPNF